MTEHQKTKLLRKLSNENMTRAQISDFYIDQTGRYDGNEIDQLCEEKLVDMVSTPVWNQGVFVPRPDDIFGIADGGKDRLDDIRKERFRLYLPIIVSVLSLVVSIIALVNSSN